MYRPIFRVLGLLMAGLVCLGSLSACSGEVLDPQNPPAQSNGSGTAQTPTETTNYTITCDGTSYTASLADAVSVVDNALVLTRAGTYCISGNRQGQIRVSVAKTEEVTLVLDGLTVTCDTTAPLYVESADRVYIEIPAGKTATLTDTANYVFPPEKDKPNACLYSSDDLTFRGEGELIVSGNFNNGIGCKNDIVIESGKITVYGVNNAIKGNGSVTVTGTANVTVTNGEDGIKSDSLLADKGYVLIDGEAVVNITCLDDALQGVSYVTVADTAQVFYRCDGDPVNCDGIINVAEGAMVPMEPAA